jgi:FkbM family methyltransferase
MLKRPLISARLNPEEIEKPGFTIQRHRKSTRSPSPAQPLTLEKAGSLLAFFAMNRAGNFYNQIKSSASAQWFIKYSRAGQIRTYIRWFGWADAFKVLWRRFLSWEKPVRINNPRLKFPVFIRATTTDPFVYSEVLVRRVYDAALPATARFIIDAGANIGLASVFFSDRYPEARIIAIEPSDKNMALLRKNVALYPNVHPKLAGLWPTSGPLRVMNPDSEAWAIQVQPCSKQESDFEGITIPGILKEYQVNQIDLLKIDIEGSEWPLLFEGIPDWLAAVHFLIIELHHREKDSSFDEVVHIMDKYGLKLLDEAHGTYIFTRRLNKSLNSYFLYSPMNSNSQP